MPAATKQVRVIPAAVNFIVPESNDCIMKKVAAYCRVSTDSEEQQNSYEAQVDYYTKYIKGREEWDFVDVYADEGITGTSTKKRTDFKRLLADCEAGKIDLIITKSIARFARNTLDCLQVVRQLKEKGIGVLFEKENINTLDNKSEVILTILASIAQDEIRNLSENVAWGKRRSAENGNVSVAYSRFLGYTKGENGGLKVVPEEAETVKLIYTMYLEGKAPNYIANYLTAQGIKTPAGKDIWRTCTIFNILQNEKYHGDALLQKTYIADYLTKAVKVNHGELPQYYIENSHEAIIPKAMFDMVQEEMKKRGGRHKQCQTGHAFSSKIICGDCGGYFGRKVLHSNTKYRRIVWRCNEQYKAKGSKTCSMCYLDERVIKTAFVNMFNALFGHRAEVLSTLETVVESVLMEDNTEVALQDKQIYISGLETELRNLIAQNAAVAQDQEEYTKRFERLNAKYERAKEDAAQLQQKQRQTVARLQSIKLYFETLKSCPEMLKEFDERVFNATVETIVVKGASMMVFNLKDGTQQEWNIG